MWGEPVRDTKPLTAANHRSSPLLRRQDHQLAIGAPAALIVSTRDTMRYRPIAVDPPPLNPFYELALEFVAAFVVLVVMTAL